MTVAPFRVDEGLRAPGGDGGLRRTFRETYLLRLLVRRELRARYKGSLLGLGWSYVRPAVHFAVYFYVIGVFLGMDDRVENFPVYLFSGMVLINLFTETLHSTTRSVTGNAALVRKVFLPRELFPTASVLVSLVHFLPGLMILLGGAVAAGWRRPRGAGRGRVRVRDRHRPRLRARAVLRGRERVLPRPGAGRRHLHDRHHLVGADDLSVDPRPDARARLGAGPLPRQPARQRRLPVPAGLLAPRDRRRLRVPAPPLRPRRISLAVSVLVFVAGHAAFSLMQARFAQEM
ncbi:ABC transporter permease [Actinomadura luteofluorescens]|uniref:ABC transporter permease n=1 Tax=Actinomadura luteofluorescens TaxID=46163 RepID=UPI00363FA6A2